MLQIKQTFGDITVEEYRQARVEAAEALAEAGTSTKLLNDATKAFLQIQNTFTLNMDTLATAFGSAANVVNDVIQHFNDNADKMFLRDDITEEHIKAMETLLNYANKSDLEKINLSQEEIQKNKDATELLNSLEGFDTSKITQEVIDRYNNRYFGGPVAAGNPYLVGDGVNMNQAELFVPEVDGKILSNRELSDLMSQSLTDDENNSILEVNIQEEYKQAIETKRQTLAVLENMRKYAKNKMLDDRLKAAIDASGA